MLYSWSLQESLLMLSIHGQQIITGRERWRCFSGRTRERRRESARCDTPEVILLLKIKDKANAGAILKGGQGDGGT